MMLYLQGTQINTRMTRQEDQIGRQQAQIDQIIQEQGRASVWRMQTGEAVDTLVIQAATTENARKAGAKWYRRALTIALGLAVLALMVSCAALAMVRT